MATPGRNGASTAPTRSAQDECGRDDVP